MRTDSKYLLPDWCKYNIPPRLITGAISDCCKAYKTGFSSLKNKTIIKFTLNYKTKKDIRQCLYIEKSCFGKGNVLFPTYKFGKLAGVYNRNTKLSDITIDHDCRLTRNGSEYYLHIPTDNYKQPKPYRCGTISLDSGIRTFQTGYVVGNGQYTVELGKYCMNGFKSQLDKTDKLHGIASTCNRSKRRKLFSRIKRINTKIANRIDDLHWKTIDFLTNNYMTIVVSDFKISQLLKNKRLNRGSKRMLCLLSHYKFRLRLIEKCKQRGNSLWFVDESYTSKTCTQCGRLNNSLGSSKHFNCIYCGLQIDRDVNGARNILIKNWELISPPVEL